MPFMAVSILSEEPVAPLTASTPSNPCFSSTACRMPSKRAGKAQKPGGSQRQQRPSAFLGKKTVLLHAKDLLCPLDISCLNIV